MKYVLDASVAVKWMLPEEDSERAALLRISYASEIDELIAPDIFPAEMAHALTKAERRGIIAQGEAISKLGLVLRSLPVLYPYLPLLPRAVEIASSIRMGVWDCLYVALAERERCELVTSDERLVKNVSGQFAVLLLADLT
jgi:predicted nucleic acid-binding protein